MGLNVGNLVNDAGNFAAGMINAWSSDNLAGAGRQEQHTTAGQLGAAFGDAGATIQGLFEFGEGIGGEVAGVLADSTGVGALGGVPLNIASAGVIVHGAVTGAEGLSHLVMSAVNDPGGIDPTSGPSSGAGGVESREFNRIPGSSDEENAVDQYLQSKGDRVEPNPLEGQAGAGRQPDRLVNGVPTEYKTLSGVANPTADSLSAAESSRIMDARGQSSNVIVDVRGQQGMTKEIAERGVARAYGADTATGDPKIQSVRIIGNGFDITVPRSN